MNEPDRVAEAARWLRFAREDLETAEALLESERLVPRHACLPAQQAAEKAIKAGLIREGLHAPFIRSLEVALEGSDV